MRRMGLNPRPALHVRSLAICVEDSDARWSTVRAVASQLDTSTRMDLLIPKPACLHETLGHLDMISAWQEANCNLVPRGSSLLFSIIAWLRESNLIHRLHFPQYLVQSTCCCTLVFSRFFQLFYLRGHSSSCDFCLTGHRLG